ncbi:AfsR/SARP family transcriptional regulator [Saccharothrix coeruleofusca]|uniref:SARP family transcriptional regulator n=1 Tax=Saccharothrix coeruleofusca TaxID=33919 RepID=A0A918APJ1_9PSEU|nr:BTAD domain-containing putative transcriptional regulator [Saccharothrix coeruleofusca]MBP2337560.1 putative ATPase/DNA-binding SARP family transcriptional activator [Saccharothrix coeruleofusca]GGP64947.1 SARP family transcriptional regulator [Saccharothrix coeruleofusca]
MRFGILGALAVWTTDDRPVQLPGRKVRALLAALLVHEGRPVSADRLADLLWPQSPPGNPVGALHTRVWQLRRALEAAEPGGGELVVSHPPGYLVDLSAAQLDAAVFTELTAAARDAADPRARAALLDQALALWRGEVLADFADEEFARPTAARLHEQRLTAVEERAEAMLELGEHSVLVGELTDLLARHPLRERLRAAQMRALHAAGRRGEALTAFDELRARLADELGLSPSPELVALRQAILEDEERAAPALGPITTATRVRTNLPARVNELIGRDRAVVQVRALLEAGRLLTLTGMGGVGKTRLALEVAERVAGEHPDGVWLVELAAVDPAAPADRDGGYSPVANQVAEALGIRDETVNEGGVVPLPVRLADALRAKQMLLVLDNCEHVVDEVAVLAVDLLRAAPGLRLLATSQVPLGIAGERLWTVPPLALPDPAAAGDPAQVARAGAVRLFLARVAAGVPGFRLDRTNAEAVESICRRLDGLPFALELAATRVRSLGVHEVAHRLEDRFALLRAGGRDAPARQQTLRAAIDWSWELLAEDERAVLRRLSVFSGGATLEAAERVCAGGGVAPDEVVDLVARLVDRSLVNAADGPGGRRFWLLESVAAYAADRLRAAGERDEVDRRHVRYATELAQRLLPHLRGPRQREWLERVDAEAADLRAALDGAVRLGMAEHAVRQVNGLAWYWFLRGRLGEARRAFATALGVAGPVPAAERATALAWQAAFALRAGDSTHSLEHYDRLVEEIEDPRDRATVRWFLGFARIGFGEHDEAEKRIDQALGEFHALEDRWGCAAALAALAKQAVLRGELEASRRCGEESARLFGELGDRWGQLLANDALALLAEVRGQYDRAARLHRDGLRIAEGLQLWTEVSTKLAGLGRIALLNEEHDAAKELHERAMRLAAEQSNTFGEHFAEVGLALGARRLGRLDEAEAHLRRWLAWCRQVDGALGLALVLAELGFVAEQRGDAARALELHREGCARAWAVGDPRAVALAVEGVAGAVSLAGDHERAALLLGAATAARAAAGAPLPAAERGDIDRVSARCRAALGQAAFEAALERGRELSLAEARSLIPRD